MKRLKLISLLLTLTMLFSIISVVPTSAEDVAEPGPTALVNLDFSNFDGTAASIVDVAGGATISATSSSVSRSFSKGTFRNLNGVNISYLDNPSDPTASNGICISGENIRNLSEYTISMYVRLPETYDGARVLSFRKTSDTDCSLDMYAYRGWNGGVSFRTAKKSGGGFINEQSYYNFAGNGFAGKWIHFLFAKKWDDSVEVGGTGTITWDTYINGQRIESAGYSGTEESAVRTNETDYNLYLFSLVESNFSDVDISYFKIYNTALDSEAAASEYENTYKNYFESTTVLDLDFTNFNGNATSIIDVANNATVNSTATTQGRSFTRDTFTNLNGEEVVYVNNPDDSATANGISVTSADILNLNEYTISMYIKMPKEYANTRLIQLGEGADEKGSMEMFCYGTQKTIGLRPCRTADDKIYNTGYYSFNNNGFGGEWIHFLFTKKWADGVEVGDTGAVSWETYINGIKITDASYSGTKADALRNNDTGYNLYLLSLMNTNFTGADISYFKMYDVAFSGDAARNEFASTYRDYMEKETLLDLGFEGEVGSAATLKDKGGNNSITFTTASAAGTENPVTVRSFPSAAGKTTEYLEFGSYDEVLDTISGGGVKIGGVHSGNLPEVTYEMWIRIPEYVSKTPAQRFFTLNSSNNTGTEGSFFDSYMHGGNCFGLRPAIAKKKDNVFVYTGANNYGGWIAEQGWYKGQDIATEWVHFVFTQKWSNLEPYSSSTSDADSDGYIATKPISNGFRGDMEFVWYRNGQPIPTSNPGNGCYLTQYPQGNPCLYENVYRYNETNSVIGLLMAGGTSTATLHAEIGAFRVYNTALTPLEIANLYDSQALSFTEGAAAIELTSSLESEILPIAGELTLTFSDYVKPASITNAFDIKDAQGNSIKGGVVPYIKSVADKTVYLKYGALQPETDYTLVINQRLQNSSGYNIAETERSFSTKSKYFLYEDFEGNDYVVDSEPVQGKGLIYNSYNNDTDANEPGNASAFVIKKDENSGKKFLQVKGGYDGGSENTYLDVDSNYFPQVEDGIVVAEVSIRSQYGAVGYFNTDCNVMSYNGGGLYISSLRNTNTIKPTKSLDTIQTGSSDTTSPFNMSSRNANGFFDARYVYEKNAEGKYTATLYNANDASYVPYTTTPVGSASTLKDFRVLHMYPINQTAYESDRAEIASIKIYKASDTFVLSSEGYDAANNSVTVTFSDDITASTVIPANISVTKDSNDASVVVASAEYDEDTRTVTIEFADKLAPNQDYTISFGKVTSVNGIAPTAYTFNAENPVAAINGDVVFKNQSGAVINTTAGITKAIASFNFTNWSPSSVATKFIMAAYEIINGKPSKFAGCDLSADATLVSGADKDVILTIENLDSKKTYEIKVFAWESLTSLTPYVVPVSISNI